MRLLGATGSHVGNVREANQDRAFFRGMVAALADGMGGHQGGERAAELAIGEFESAPGRLSETDLVALVIAANRQVHGHAADHGLAGMGTTLVALTLHEDNTITVANVGDSRAYWFRDDYMAQITEDHSFVEDLVRQGRLSAADAATHPQRNILTRAVGIGAEVEVDRFPVDEPAVGDRFLLCSDGLFNELSETEIIEILNESAEPTQAAARLVEATLQTPCRDNVTVAVVDLVEDDDPRLPPEEEIEDASKVITAPIPDVSKSVLRKTSPTKGGGEVLRNGGGGDSGARAAGTMLLDDKTPRHGVTVNTGDPEEFQDTAELAVGEPESMGVRPRRGLALGLGGLILLAVVAVAGFFGARSYAGSGYFIAEDADTGELAIMEGRRGGFLVFEPQVVTQTSQTLPADDPSSLAIIQEDFSSLAEAEDAIETLAEQSAASAAAAAESSEAEVGGSSSSSSESSDETETSDTTQLGDTGEAEDTSSSSTDG